MPQHKDLILVRCYKTARGGNIEIPSLGGILSTRRVKAWGSLLNLLFRHEVTTENINALFFCINSSVCSNERSPELNTRQGPQSVYQKMVKGICNVGNSRIFSISGQFSEVKPCLD